MRTIHLIQPRKIVFGEDASLQCVDDILALDLRRIFFVTSEAIPRMANAAMKVTRLLRLNPREVSVRDAEEIYRAAL